MEEERLLRDELFLLREDTLLTAPGTQLKALTACG
jgi:hypothetical protein